MADPLSISASIVTVLQLAKDVIGYLNDARNAPKDRQRLRDEISSTAYYLYMLKDAAERAARSDEIPPSITSLFGDQGPLKQFQSALEQLTAKLIPVGRFKGPACCLIWPFERSHIDQILASIERQKGLFTLALQTEDLTLSRATLTAASRLNDNVKVIGAKVENLHLTQTATEDIRLLDWLSTADSWAKQHVNCEKRVEGTCEWIFKTPEFEAWKVGKIRMLWCPGIPGAGKTMLVSVVIDHLEAISKDPVCGLAFVYCNYANRTRTCVSMLSEMIRHLLVQRPKSLPLIQAMFDKHRARGSRPRLTEIFSCFQDVASTFSRIYIVVDALDECTEEIREELITTLNGLPPNVSILVTSRPIDIIGSDLQEPTRLDISADQDDIVKYVQDRVQSSSRLRKLVAADQELNILIIHTIAREAHGMFLLAHQHMNLLARKRSKPDLIGALGALPKELDSTYDEALARIDEQNEEDKQLARRMLTWVTASFHQLSIKQLQMAFAISVESLGISQAAFVDEEILISVCCGLVAVEKESGMVGFIHDTVRDYFDRIRDSYLTNSHRDIAITCLVALNQLSSGQDAWLKQLGEEAHAFVEYAVNTWGFHATAGGIDDYVSRLILSYLENPAHSNLTKRYMSIDSIPMILHVSSWKFDVLQTVLQSFNCLHLVSLFLIPTGLAEKLFSNSTSEKIGQDVEAAGWTPLTFAIKCGHEAFAAMLIKDDRVNINAGEGSLLGTALHAAVSSSQDHRIIIETLLLKGANVHALRWNARTPLHDAAEAGNPDAVELLLASGSDNKALTLSGTTPLYRAIRGGNTEVIRLLYQRDPNVNVQTWDFWTPLHEAACCNNAHMIEVLLEYGADTSTRNLNGHTALDLAESLGNHQARDALYAQTIETCLQNSSRAVELTEAKRKVLTDALACKPICNRKDANSHATHGDISQRQEMSFEEIPQGPQQTMDTSESVRRAISMTETSVHPKLFHPDVFSADRLMQVNPTLSQKFADRLVVMQERSYALLHASKKTHDEGLTKGWCWSAQMGHLCCSKELAREILLLVVNVVTAIDPRSLASRADSLFERLSDPTLQQEIIHKNKYGIILKLPTSVECPLCFNAIKVESWLGWILHAISDLEPYTYNVYDIDRSFSRQIDWKRHDQIHYPSIISQCPFPECDLHCTPTFFQRHHIIDHIIIHHQRSEVKPGSRIFAVDGKTLSLEDLLSKSQLGPQRKTPTSCIFCGRVLSSLPMYCDHAAAHKEQIALQVLRKFVDDHYMN